MDEKTEVSPGRALEDMVTICAKQSLENATLLERCAELEAKIAKCSDCGAENIAETETSFCRKCEHPIWPKE